MSNAKKPAAKKAAKKNNPLSQLQELLDKITADNLSTIERIKEENRKTIQAIREMRGGSKPVGINRADHPRCEDELVCALRRLAERFENPITSGVGDKETETLLKIINSNAAEICRQLGICLPQIKGAFHTRRVEAQKPTKPAVPGEIHIYRQEGHGGLRLVKSIISMDIRRHLSDDLNS